MVKYCNERKFGSPNMEQGAGEINTGLNPCAEFLSTPEKMPL